MQPDTIEGTFGFEIAVPDNHFEQEVTATAPSTPEEFFSWLVAVAKATIEGGLWVWRVNVSSPYAEALGIEPGTYRFDEEDTLIERLT